MSNGSLMSSQLPLYNVCVRCTGMLRRGLNWNIYEFSSTPAIYPNATAAANTYVEDIALGDVVDIVFINPGAMVHPMHIHGNGE